MNAVPLDRAAGKRTFIGVDVHRTPQGYTLTLHRREGVFPVLEAGGREPKRWQDLDEALAFLVARYGAMSSIHLKLDED